MSEKKTADREHPTVSVSQERVTELMTELEKRLMLVTDGTLNHLRSHGVIPQEGDSLRMMRAECCKPDGGTCCVNKK
jgi:hypothetical protein